MEMRITILHSCGHKQRHLNLLVDLPAPLQAERRAEWKTWPCCMCRPLNYIAMQKARAELKARA